MIVGGGVPDALDGASVTARGEGEPPDESTETTDKSYTANHAHLRGVEDAAPYK